MTNSQINQEIRQFVKICLWSLSEKPVASIADAANLSTQTVYRLQQGKASMYTRFSTVQKIGQAAGLYLKLTKTKAVMGPLGRRAG